LLYNGISQAISEGMKFILKIDENHIVFAMGARALWSFVTVSLIIPVLIYIDLSK
jgi:hypothetical protein